jgi:hypothetical protein
LSGAIAIALFCMVGCHHKPRPIVMLPNTGTGSGELWKEAARQVEEDRNEPMGSRARVEVPEELKQYSNRHQFLGTQVAEVRKQRFQIPLDCGDLIPLIEEGELVEMPPVGKYYVLFGIGGVAGPGPLTRYNIATRSSVPLYGDEEEAKKAAAELTDRIAETTGSIAELVRELHLVGRRDRRRATTLRGEISNKQRLVASLSDSKAVIDFWYGDPVRRAGLFAEHERIAAFASDFGGSSYNLADPDARLEFKRRLLSCIRPPARSVLEEIAEEYDREFKRPLPITSMIRTVEYQRELGEVNPNAARNAVPPHTTGLAFDVYYHYMTAAEQDFLMKEIARMKDAGRVEALREARDHFHIFAFADGQRPSGQLIAESTMEMGETAAAPSGRSRIASTVRWKPRPTGLRLASHRRSHT